MTIDEIVEDFLSLTQKDLLSQRFNLFLTSGQIQFLTLKGIESSEGTSNYLHTLIDNARKTN